MKKIPCMKKNSLFFISIITAVFALLCLAGFLAIAGIIWISNTQKMYGFVNTKGQFVIPPKFDFATDFENGKARVNIFQGSCDTPRECYIDTKGKAIGSCHETSSACFDTSIMRDSTGAPYPQKYKYDPNLVADSDSKEDAGTYGYRNSRYDWIIKPQYSRALSFSNGIAWVAIPNGRGSRLWGLIDKKGHYLLKPKCTSAGPFVEGLARCRINVTFGSFY